MKSKTNNSKNLKNKQILNKTKNKINSKKSSKKTPVKENKKEVNIKVNNQKKKSNYHKVQQKATKKIQEQKEISNRKKIVRNKKHEVRIKKQEEIKNRTFLKKIKLIILSYFIKTKKIIIKNLKNIKKYISLFQQKLFIFFKTKKNRREDTSKFQDLKKINEQAKLQETKEQEDLQEKKVFFKSLFGKKIPNSSTKSDRKRRKTIYLKEALLFSIIMTLIDIVLFYKVSSINILTIFDNNIWNLVVTIFLTLLILLISSYLFDYLITEFIFKKNMKQKKKYKMKDKNKKQGD